MPNTYESKFQARQAELRSKLGIPEEGGGPGGAIVPFEKTPGVAEAAFKVGIAYLATKPPVVGIDKRSWIDRQQEKFARLGNIVATRVGAEKSEMAFPEHIEREVQRVEQTYRRVIPNDMDLIVGLEGKIIRDAKEMAEAVNRGELDNDYEPTEAERAVAYELRMMMGRRTAQQLAEYLRYHVASVANDISLGRNGANLQYQFPKLNSALQAFDGQKPRVMFYPDIVTSNLVMTGEEQKALENTYWGITPTSLTISDTRRVKGRAGSADVQRFNLANMSVGGRGSGEGIVVQKGTLEAFDILRRGLFRPFQTTLERVQQNMQVGGLVVLQDYDRDRSVAEFAVRNPDHTISQIRKAADLARAFAGARDMARKALFEHEAAYKRPIRPRVVRSLLPEGDLMLEMDFHRNAQGEVEFETPMAELARRRKQIEDRLANAAIEALSWLDSAGNPTRRKDKITLDRGKEELKKVQNLEEKLRDAVVKEGIELGKEFSCEYCGAPLKTGATCVMCGGRNNNPRPRK